VAGGSEDLKEAGVEPAVRGLIEAEEDLDPGATAVDDV
jgi:hypothetical protein